MPSLFAAILCLASGCLDLAVGRFAWAAILLGLSLANAMMFKVNMDD